MVRLNVDMTRTEADELRKLKDILNRHPGPCQTSLRLSDPARAEVTVALPEALKIQPDPALVREVEALLGRNALETACKPL